MRENLGLLDGWITGLLLVKNIRIRQIQYEFAEKVFHNPQSIMCFYVLLN